MIDRRVPMGGGYDIHPIERPSKSAFSTGNFYVQLHHDGVVTPTAVNIVPISPQERRLLEGDYLKDRSQFLRMLAAGAIFWGVNAIKHSGADAVVASGSALGLMEVLPLRDGILWSRRDTLKHKVFDKEHTWRFFGRPVALSLPLDRLAVEVDFITDDLGYQASIPTADLIKSVADFPGLSVHHRRGAKKVRAELCPGPFIGTILNQLHQEESKDAANQFISSTEPQLNVMHQAYHALPNVPVTPELASVNETLQAQMFVATLGIYATFLAHERTRVANKLNIYDAQLPLPQSRLSDTDRMLRDVTTPMSWHDILNYERAIPSTI